MKRGPRIAGGKKVKGVSREHPLPTFERPPSGTAWIETDAYDRARWAEMARDAPSIRAAAESGTVLLPHFAALLRDLFAALYKTNTVWLPEAAVAPSARVNRSLLGGLLAESAVELLRARTRLDLGRAALGAVLLGERALDLLRQEKLFTRRDLLDHFDLARDEEELARRTAELDAAAEMENEKDLPEARREEVRALAERMARDGRLARLRLDRKAAEVAREAAARGPQSARRLELEALSVAQALDEAADEAESFGRALGAGTSGSAAQSLELGRRLARSPKLHKLARLLGRMHQQTQALRRRFLERPVAEVHEIESGADPGRLLPQELVALRHPILRRDFARRFVERECLQYRLRGDDECGRGPMIVCLDVSSSMAGDKEIWAKAVALTLLDVARRERRRYRAVLFSSAETPLRVLDLVRGDERWTADLSGALDLAEYFPGGGTDFERPLDAALDCLGESRFRRGDVVLVTDGECRVGDDWQQRFLAEKKRLDFSLYAILIDVGGAALETLRVLADRISRVSELSDEGVKDLFARI